MSDTLLKDYYKAKLSLEILTLEVKEKGEAVLALLREMPDGKAGIPEAKFYVRSTPSYAFSAEVDKLVSKVEVLKEAVKVQQKTEIESGVAKVDHETMAVVMVKSKD